MKGIPVVRAFILLTVTILSACGGGGGGSTPPPVQPPPPGPPPVVFEPSTNFQASCQMPRTGIDPDTGMAFLDTQGTFANEKDWLRSWSNETYLWYDEINYLNAASFPDPIDYFDTLKTLATTPSGNARDQFHFSVDTETWNQISQSGVSLSYGASLVITSSLPPREVIVSFVQPGSEAATAGLSRGDRIITIDGIDVVNNNTQAGVDTINAGLFPEVSGETHSFVYSPIGSGGDTSITMEAADVTFSPVLETSVINNSPSSRVGYILFNDQIATAEAQLIDAVNTLKAGNVTDLVLDLRYNGGGFLAIAAQMSYMIAGPVTQGRTFELQEFSDKYPSVNPITGDQISPFPFIDETIGFSVASGQALPSLDLNRVFVISGENTCSASESIINGLRGVNIEVILIGSTTCGKPYGFYPQDNCGTTFFTIQFSGSNDIGFGDYPDGFSPQNTLGIRGELITGCSVDDDFSAALGDVNEARLAAALQYLNSSSCPVPPQPVSSVISSSGVSVFGKPSGLPFSVDTALLEQSFLRQNRFLGMP